MKTISSLRRPMGRSPLVVPARVVVSASTKLTIGRQRLTAPKVSILRRRSTS